MRSSVAQKLWPNCDLSELGAVTIILSPMGLLSLVLILGGLFKVQQLNKYGFYDRVDRKNILFSKKNLAA